MSGSNHVDFLTEHLQLSIEHNGEVKPVRVWCLKAKQFPRFLRALRAVIEDMGIDQAKLMSVFLSPKEKESQEAQAARLQDNGRLMMSAMERCLESEKVIEICAECTEGINLLESDHFVLAKVLPVWANLSFFAPQKMTAWADSIGKMMTEAPKKTAPLRPASPSPSLS